MRDSCMSHGALNEALHMRGFEDCVFNTSQDGVASVSKIDKITGLFCKRAL